MDESSLGIYIDGQSSLHTLPSNKTWMILPTPNQPSYEYYI